MKKHRKPVLLESVAPMCLECKGHDGVTKCIVFESADSKWGAGPRCTQLCAKCLARMTEILEEEK